MKRNWERSKTCHQFTGSLHGGRTVVRFNLPVASVHQVLFGIDVLFMLYANNTVGKNKCSFVCSVVELTGDVTPDMRAIAQADLIVTTPEKWDGVSRSWQNRSYVQKVAILIIDEIHLLGKRWCCTSKFLFGKCSCADIRSLMKIDQIATSRLPLFRETSCIHLPILHLEAAASSVLSTDCRSSFFICCFL